MASIRRLVDSEIEPYVEAWEAAQAFPAHDLFRKLGRAGLLGITRPEAFGGMGYTWDNRASRALRDYRLCSIGGGADEVVLGIIAKSMGLGSR